jgi:hypothetical protein
MPRSIECVEATRQSNGAAPEGFCLITYVLASVPTAPDSTSYTVFLYQTCTFSVPFRRKTARNRESNGQPVFARANPVAGRRNPASPSHI